MESHEAYKKFNQAALGPVNEEDFMNMFYCEVGLIEGEQKRQRQSVVNEEAYLRLQSWYQDAHQQIIRNLPHFIATHRRQYVWAVLLRHSHEPAFKTVTWLAAHLTP